MATTWKEPIAWANEGAEPSDNLKTNGFKAGDKPPADVFNHFFNRTGECINELQDHADTHTHDDRYYTESEMNTKLAAKSDTTHTHNAATTSDAGFMSKDDKTKLNGVATGAEVNQNAFSKVTVGSTTINAGSKTDTFTLVAGSNVTLTPDSTNKKVTIAAANGSTVVAATSSDGVAYTATVDGVTSLYNGLTITILPSMQSTSRTPTLNVNGLGAKRMVMPINGANTSGTTQPPVVYNDETTEDELNSKIAVASKWLSANKPVTVRYDGTYWETDIHAQSASNLYGSVPIESGGTGADNAAEACANLSALQYVAQTLTNDQKNQVRTNIGVTDAYINSLIDTKLGVIENGSY